MIPCANLALGACRKVVCERCFAGFDLGAASSDFPCAHCRGACPARAQCVIYDRINRRASVKRRKAALERTHRVTGQPTEVFKPAIRPKLKPTPKPRARRRSGMADTTSVGGDSRMSDGDCVLQKTEEGSDYAAVDRVEFYQRNAQQLQAGYATYDTLDATSASSLRLDIRGLDSPCASQQPVAASGLLLAVRDLTSLPPPVSASSETSTLPPATELSPKANPALLPAAAGADAFDAACIPSLAELRALPLGGASAAVADELELLRLRADAGCLPL